MRGVGFAYFFFFCKAEREVGSALCFGGQREGGIRDFGGGGGGGGGGWGGGGCPPRNQVKFRLLAAPGQ